MSLADAWTMNEPKYRRCNGELAALKMVSDLRAQLVKMSMVVELADRLADEACELMENRSGLLCDKLNNAQAAYREARKRL